MGSMRWQHEEGGGGGGDWAGHSGETVDYESHQVINDFINKTDHAAVIAVTRAEGWPTPNAPFPLSLPPSFPAPSLSFQYCLPLPTTRERQGKKGMELGVDGGGGRLVMRKGVGG